MPVDGTNLTDSQGNPESQSPTFRMRAMEYLMRREPPRYRYRSSEGGSLPWRAHTRTEAVHPYYVDEEGNLVYVEGRAGALGQPSTEGGDAALSPRYLQDSDSEIGAAYDQINKNYDHMYSNPGPRAGDPKGLWQTLAFKLCGVRPALSIVVAMDSFKGTLSSREACKAAEDALCKLGITKVYTQPMSDGGEGWLQSCRVVFPEASMTPMAKVTGPMGTVLTERPLLMDLSNKVAVIESAAIVGLTLVPESQLDPFKATSYGVGEQILHAIDMGATRIYVGVGGTCTIDGGAGMAQALGVRFFDSNGKEIKEIDTNIMPRIASADLSKLAPEVMNVEFIAACDVRNGLLGCEGAVPLYGPQKGLRKEDMPDLDHAMQTYATSVERAVNMIGLSTALYTGAGGGLAYALAAFCGAELKSGFDIISDKADLMARIKKSHLVITGEGQFDAGSMYGKVPVRMSNLAKSCGTKCFVFAGRVDQNILDYDAEGISCIIPLVDDRHAPTPDTETSKELLHKAVERSIKLLILGQNMKLKTDTKFAGTE